MTAVLRFLRGEPALAYVSLLYTAVALVVAYGHLTAVQGGYLTAIATGLGAVITASLARPVNVAIIAGGVGTVLSSLVVFSVHVSKPEIGATVAAVGLVLGLILRQHLTPAQA